LILVVSCLMLACKKSEPVSPGLFGKWELRRQYGGFAGFDSTYKAGNGRIYQFNSDSTYQQFNKSSIVATGVFHIQQEQYAPGTTITVIVFVNRADGERFSFSGTKLTIGADIDDGIASDYEKIQN